MNSKKQTQKAFIDACSVSCDLEIVKYFISRGHDIRSKYIYGATAMRSASVKGSLEIVKCLIENGIGVNEIDQNGCAPLHYSSYNAHLELSKYLLSVGANPLVKSNSGESALSFADPEIEFDNLESRKRTIRLAMYEKLDQMFNNQSKK